MSMRLREGVTVAIIEEPWETVSPTAFTGPFDVVIASYSLMMVDLRAALRRCTRSAAAGSTSSGPLTPPGGRDVERALWPAIHGADYPPEPMADCVWNVLFQMGIMATLEAEFTRLEHRFRDLDEAVAEFRDRLNCPGRCGDHPPVDARPPPSPRRGR